MQFFSLAGHAKVSRIALGGNVFGHFTDEAQTAAIIDTAQDAGINFIDTADVYSQGLSESLIGKILAKHRHHWVIASKVGLESYGDPRGLGRAQTIRQRVEASLERLKTDYIDLYQMHHFDPSTPVEETLQCLDDLRREGKVRAYGVSNYSKDNFSTTCAVAQRLSIPFPVSIQCHYNLFARSAEADLFPICGCFGVRALLYGVLARGILSSKYKSPDNIPASARASISASIRSDLKPEVISAVLQMTQAVEEVGVTLVQAALAWSLRLPEIGAAIIGMRTPEQVVSLTKGIDIKLPDNVKNRLEALGQQAWAANPFGFGSIANLQAKPKYCA